MKLTSFLDSTWYSAYHRGTRDVVGRTRTTDPSTDDILSRGKDIHNGSEVGEGSTSISNGTSTNGVGRRSTSR